MGLMFCSSVHEEPRDTEDDGDNGNAGHDVLLVPTVEEALHSRSETPSSSSSPSVSAIGFCLAAHFLSFQISFTFSHFLARFLAGSYALFMVVHVRGKARREARNGKTAKGESGVDGSVEV